MKAKKSQESQDESWTDSAGGGTGGGGQGGGYSGGGKEDAWLEVGKGGAKAVVNAPDPRRQISNSSVVRFILVLL